MKKRKLTRKSLDELAKIMPVLSEDEQRACIGGEIYYSPEGYRLGQVGDGYGIRVINQNDFNEVGSCTDSGCKGHGTGLSGVSVETKELIMNEIASGMGISQYIRFYSGPSDKYGRWDAKSGIMININNPSFVEGNEYDFMMILLHEYTHSITPINNKDGMCSDKDIAEWEYKAYLRVTNDENFSKASETYRKGAIDMLNRKKAEAGIK